MVEWDLLDTSVEIREYLFENKVVPFPYVRYIRQHVLNYKCPKEAFTEDVKTRITVYRFNNCLKIHP